MLATDEQRQKLVDFFHTGTKLTYGKGEYVVRPGDSPRGVLYIESGFVKAHDITKYGEENVLIIRTSGELVGLTFAVIDRDHTIIYSALSEVVLWMIPFDKLQQHIKDTPDIAVPMLDMVTRMYHLHGGRIMTLEYRTVRERMASFLLNVAERFGTPNQDGIQLAAPLRHQDIASSVSATRETASRTLSEFERKGYISQSRSQITITNKEALEHMLSS
jgi:CRP/FNR family transcriptional regulator, cyclic AMP receptor protein